ncbi:Pectin lyase-like superfamily protein [Perilla frutescens var. hirtella]|uniref:Pectin lyase-like superfamily protein n=1 Tax=Perilla frutescens var. hirtella TaxID=608512 RepID=A0AAD4JBK5_PERFH|nr:Pectin lyase-like superfamily protein [Perilla frutescens var. hirtella]
MRLSFCNKLQISGLKHKDIQRNHISIDACDNSQISNLHIIAAATSPNTDGIDIGRSSNLHIEDCVMEIGDDCIAINEGTSSLYISRITCGPGHGIRKSIISFAKNRLLNFSNHKCYSKFNPLGCESAGLSHDVEWSKGPLSGLNCRGEVCLGCGGSWQFESFCVSSRRIEMSLLKSRRRVWMTVGAGLSSESERVGGCQIRGRGSGFRAGVVGLSHSKCSCKSFSWSSCRR